MGRTRMLLEVNHITGKKKGFHLQDIHFSLEEGYLLGITGKNGAGKTTLFRYIMEQKSQYDGEILLDGKNIQTNREEAMNKIGFVSEERIFFENYTIAGNAELLGIFYQLWDQKKFEELIEKMGLKLGMKLGRLSRGERIKFQIAFAVAQKPRLYLMDEPTAGMDPIFRKEFFRIVQELLMDGDSSVIMTSHIQEEIEEKMDIKAVMDKGRLISYKEAYQ